jgi:hypothetical protein
MAQLSTRTSDPSRFGLVAIHKPECCSIALFKSSLFLDEIGERKKHPRKIKKIEEASPTLNQRIAKGIQASGDIGRNTCASGLSRRANCLAAKSALRKSCMSGSELILGVVR